MADESSKSKSESNFKHKVILAWRDLALAFPEVVEGDSCVKRSFKVRKKGFLFLGEGNGGYNVMVKLGPSLEEAASICADHPNRTVGKMGWTTLKLADDERPPKGVVERWIEESYRLQATKAILAQLDEG